MALMTVPLSVLIIDCCGARFNLNLMKFTPLNRASVLFSGTVAFSLCFSDSGALAAGTPQIQTRFAAQLAPTNALGSPDNDASGFNASRPEFWYPPYADAQPAWNGDALRLDLAAAKGKEMAILSFSLPKTIKAGESYTLRFLAKSSETASLIVLVPQAKAGATPDAGATSAPADSWAQHDRSGQINAASAMREITFRYTPVKVKENKIQFFWDKAGLENPAQWTFSDFSLVPAAQAAPAAQPTAAQKTSLVWSKEAPFPANFWYPPYADVQPRWDNGAITVNLDEPKNKGQKQAALTLKLPADMEQDADYRIRFDAVSSVGGPMIIQVPEPDARGDKQEGKFVARGDWQMQSSGNSKKRSVVFVNRPQLTVGGAQITLYWGEEAISNGGTWKLSHFELTKMN